MKIDEAEKIAHEVRGGPGTWQLPPRRTTEEIAEALNDLVVALGRFRRASAEYARLIGQIEKGTPPAGTPPAETPDVPFGAGHPIAPVNEIRR